MAGSEESLRLSAEIVSNFGPALKEMTRSLRSLATETSSAHKSGVVQSKAHGIALHNLRREVIEVAERNLGFLARATGLSIDQLRTFEAFEVRPSAGRKEFTRQPTGFGVFLALIGVVVAIVQMPTPVTQRRLTL
jgi:hypothetical protein